LIISALCKEGGCCRFRLVSMPANDELGEPVSNFA
jgi:hypothetical protein